MYFTRILVTALILAATTSTIRTTTGETNNAVTSTKTPATGSETKPTTPKDGISLKVGENQGTESGKNITTRLRSNGNPSNQCQCTVFYMCDQADVVTDELENAEQCPDSSEVCCRSPIHFNPSPVPEFSPVVTTKYVPGECGIRYPSTDADDLSETSFGEFPWMALIFTTKTGPDGVATKNVFVCGASLISETIVLTAAHCVHDKVPEALRVRVGEYNTHQGAIEPLIHQDRQVDTISVHGEFNPKVLFNDVALVRVTEPFIFAPHINPICSPILGTQFDLNSYNRSNCFVTGWGKQALHITASQTKLRKVGLTLMEQTECQNRWRSTRLGPSFSLHPSFICAGERAGFDTCQGDGGAPVVCATNDNSNKYVQVGIVSSWIIRCASDVPSVYASVYANRDWLSVEYDTLSVFRI